MATNATWTVIFEDKTIPNKIKVAKKFRVTVKGCKI